MGLLHLIFLPQYCIPTSSLSGRSHLRSATRSDHFTPFFQPKPLACAISVFLVHVAGTLCPHTFAYHLYIYLASALFLKLISFLAPFLSCSLAHSAAPTRLFMNWHVLNS